MGEPRAYVTSFGDRHHIVYKGIDGGDDLAVGLDGDVSRSPSLS